MRLSDSFTGKDGKPIIITPGMNLPVHCVRDDKILLIKQGRVVEFPIQDTNYNELLAPIKEINDKIEFENKARQKRLEEIQNTEREKLESELEAKKMKSFTIKTRSYTRAIQEHFTLTI
jgi:hypothetical protein